MSYIMNKIKFMSVQAYNLILQWDVKVYASQFA